MMWRPRDRHGLVEWTGELATVIACAVLRHPMTREDREAIQAASARGTVWRAYCPCARRQYRSEP